VVVYSPFPEEFARQMERINRKSLFLHRRKYYRPTVALVMRSCNNRWLLACSAKADRWYTIQGGIDEGEDALEALYREAEEECGIQRSQLHVRAFIGKSAQDTTRAHKKGFLKGKYYFFFLVDYLGKEDDLVLEERELSEVRWLDIMSFVSALSEISRAKYRQVLQFLQNT
jgi:8-oxo-dGTP pyrophosphatase MutT (NUDIX family)